MLLHGFVDTWRTWELVLDRLERAHDVLAPTLAGHAGGPPLPEAMTDGALADAVERAMDEAGFETAHVAGNSLGGHVALQLAARGRARSVVTFAPAGGWAADDPAPKALLADQAALHERALSAATVADALVSTREGRRRAARLLCERWEHLPADLLAHQIRGIAACTGASAMLAHAATNGWPVEPERITCPVRVVWGTADRLLPWPSAAHRFRHEWLPHADWVVLDGVGHCPQLDVPLEAAELVLGWTT